MSSSKQHQQHQQHPKRGFFSLNVDSNADHIYERVEDHNKKAGDKDRLKVRESSGPSSGTSSIQVLGRPFEKEVQRSIERIVDGRVVRDTVTTREEDDNPSSVGIPVSKTNKKKDRSVEDKYDISDL